MGYTHYYYCKVEYDAKSFENVATDFKKMIPILDHLGVKLGDAFGENYPIITPTEICFNGLKKCGHEQRELGITWPSKTAKGVAQNNIALGLEEITKGSWFAGAELEARVCGGNYDHETFRIEQKASHVADYKIKELDENDGFFFECTKTAYKPYDLAVNVCLIIAKRHLKKNIRIHSDGEDVNWEEGRQLCQHFLGYGSDFKLDVD